MCVCWGRVLAARLTPQRVKKLCAVARAPPQKKRQQFEAGAKTNPRKNISTIALSFVVAAACVCKIW